MTPDEQHVQMITADQRAYVRYLNARLRHLERQIAPFMSMSKAELEQDHETFPVANWRMYVVLMEAVGQTVNAMADAL